MNNILAYFQQCNRNRNELLHAEQYPAMFGGVPETLYLIKRSDKRLPGSTVYLKLKLSELRKIADDMRKGVHQCAEIHIYLRFRGVPIEQIPENLRVYVNDGPPPPIGAPPALFLSPVPQSYKKMSDAKKTPVELFNEVAHLGFLDALEIIALIEVMERQNQGRVAGKLSDEGAAAAGIVIRNALITRIAILVARPFAPLRKGDLHLRRAFDELLKISAIRDHIRSIGAESDLLEAERLWSDAQADPEREKIKHFRDKYTAHLGEPTPGIANPEYNNFFAFARKTTRVMEKLAHASRGTKETLDEHYDDFIKSAQIFWKPWDPMG